MILLLASAHPTHIAERHPNLGRLVIPRDCGRVAETSAAGIPWAADNSAFAGFDEGGFRRMLAAVTDVPGCRFVAVPDVVADAAATLAQWEEWHGECAASGQPLAFVAQDGLDLADAPWGEMGALFIGGSNEYKLGPAGEAAISEALRRGLWVHMGRVNTARRFRYAKALGCHSVDGTQFSRWRRTHLPSGLAWAQAPPQMRLL